MEGRLSGPVTAGPPTRITEPETVSWTAPVNDQISLGVRGGCCYPKRALGASLTLRFSDLAQSRRRSRSTPTAAAPPGTSATQVTLRNRPEQRATLTLRSSKSPPSCVCGEGNIVDWLGCTRNVRQEDHVRERVAAHEPADSRCRRPTVSLHDEVGGVGRRRSWPPQS